ncbi:hypothetical protein [Vagococcus fluvialis]|uniref:hypothetical protein n=1 Tax=Vagococcus fluvialis TaxID=2738 RepID=UPI003B5CEC0A
MKRAMIFLSLISFIVFLSGCTSNIEPTTDSSISTNTSSSEIDKEKLSKEYMMGKWISTEDDWPMEIEIYKNNDTEQLQLDIISPKDSTETYTTASGYSSYSNSDNSIRYKFTLDQDNQLVMVKTFPNIKSNEASAVRAWLLERK